MKPKTTILLILLLVPAVVALMLTNQGGDAVQTYEEKVDDRNTLLDAAFFGSELSAITFDGGLTTPLKLKRIAGDWYVTSPHRFPAKTSKIDELLATLVELRGEPSEQYFGPNPDQGGLVLQTKDKRVSLSIGKRLGSGKAGIALMVNNEVQQFIVDDVLHDLHEQVFEPGGGHAYYAKKLRPLLMPDYQRIEIATVESESVLRQVDERWLIGEDEQAERALEHQVGEHPGLADYFKLIEAIEIQDFVEYYSTDDLANFGINRPVAIVRFIAPQSDADQADASMTLRVGVPADLADQTRYVSYGRADDPYPIVFTTQSPIALAFGQDAKRFRDPRITALSKFLIRTITIKQPDQRDVTVQLGTDRTENLSPLSTELGNYPINIAPQASNLIKQIVEARASAFVEAEPDQLTQLANIQLDAPLRNQTESIRIYEDTDAALSESSVLVRRGDEATLLRVERLMFDQLLRLPERLIQN